MRPDSGPGLDLLGSRKTRQLLEYGDDGPQTMLLCPPWTTKHEQWDVIYTHEGSCAGPGLLRTKLKATALSAMGGLQRWGLLGIVYAQVGQGKDL